MAREKDKLTNAIMAFALGLVFLMSRDFVGLLLGSLDAWFGDMWRGPRRQGGSVISLLFELLMTLISFVVTLIAFAVLWIFRTLNDTYLLPILVMFLAYATPWPFRLGFLNPRPYILRGSRWFWDMFVLSTYGEYLRRGKGRKNIAFIVLPVVGGVAVLIGAWGLWGASFRGERVPPLSGLLNVMPRERTIYVAQAVPNTRIGVKIQKVILSRQSTKLVFRWWIPDPRRVTLRLSPWAGFSQSTYLVDNQSNRYAVIGSEGMDVGKTYQLTPEEERYATLIFDPLKEDAVSFDLHFVNLETGQDWVAKDVKVR